MITWQTLSHPPLEFENYIPATFACLRLPEFKVQSSEGVFGKLCFQTYTGPNYCLQYSVIDNLQAFQLKVKTKLEGLFARIMLENHVEHSIKGAGELIIREGQFSMMTGIAPEAKLQYLEHNQYSSFDAFFTMEMLQRALGQYPELQHFFSHDLSRLPHILVDPKPAQQYTQALLDQVLQDPGSESNAQQLLENLLAQLEEKRKFKKPPSVEQLEKIYAAERIVSDDIRNHYLIPDLAKRAQTNQCTLKTFFPYVFGIGPYKYHKQKKMRLAKKLILQKIPIKNVARETGYKTNAEFSKAFKAYYNISPSDLLKRGY